MLTVQILRRSVSATPWWYAVANLLARFGGRLDCRNTRPGFEVRNMLIAKVAKDSGRD